MEKECGTSCANTSKTKKLVPTWFKWILAIASALFLVLLWRDRPSQSIAATIEKQLVALRDKKITEAYYDYTSKEFQQNVTLIAFRELIAAYDILVNNRKIQIEEKQIDDGLAKLKGTLIATNEQRLPIEYALTKEDDKWKIATIAFSSPTPTPRGTNAGVSASAEWLIPIDIELRALRDSNFSQAYEEVTAREFKAATSLDDFKTFIQNNPILTTHDTMVVRNQSLQNDQADVTVVLNPEQEAVPVRFILSREDGRWKIWNMNVIPPYSPQVTALMKDPESLKKPVQEQLEAFRENNTSKAYHGLTSKSFQKTTSADAFYEFLNSFPILSHYESFELKNPRIDGGTGKVDVELKGKNEVTSLIYTLGIEGEEWRIWGIQMLKPIPSNLVEQSEVRRQNEDQDEEGIRFKKIEVGTAVDSNGDISNPSRVFKTPTGSIYVNFLVKNGAHIKIDVHLQHLETQARIPPVSTTLESDEESRVSLSFNPPPKGWPKGHYQIEAVSSTGASRTTTFELN